jgi:aminoglycoside phosphotransferase family enzyme/predicted kinase
MVTQERATQTEVYEALMRRESYPHGPADVEVRETHISWVFLAGGLAYKLKKPLVLDFLDYRTPQRRRMMCEEEVRLNRRLAPGIYLGVRGVAVWGGRAALTVPDDPRAVDYVVEMRRYDERMTLAAKLERGELSREEVREVAGALARFHAGAQRVTDARAPALAVERRFERNFHELLSCVEQSSAIGRVLALERSAHAFIARHARTLQVRAAGGWVREGHGDLRAEHVLVDDGVQVVDCVEFDPALRRLDVADDLAFLVADLAALGSQSLGKLLVDAYRDAGGNPGSDSLIAFYAAYRALVRAKVALVRAAQLPLGSAERGDQSAAAREQISLAERFAWVTRLPLILIVCGVPGSGKSYLASSLRELSGLPHLSSDVTRKRLAGLPPTDRAPDQSYSAEWNARTYAELARRARRALATTGGAVVDGTFRHLADRQAFTSALGETARLLFVECHAPYSVLCDRAARRERHSGRISDAGTAVVGRERSSWQPLDEVPAAAHLAVRTDRPLDEIVGDVVALLDRRLQELA